MSFTDRAKEAFEKNGLAKPVTKIAKLYDVLPEIERMILAGRPAKEIREWLAASGLPLTGFTCVRESTQTSILIEASSWVITEATLQPPGIWFRAKSLAGFDLIHPEKREHGLFRRRGFPERRILTCCWLGRRLIFLAIFAVKSMAALFKACRGRKLLSLVSS